ncbi:StAR-related lipid transfer protein 9 [Acropora cervicornis]|uniref:StAR-related lipid transfer protein 9 n=1 Tax=Acropora cervicornis TaxID=6130 RepID=A0AAD9VC05_ACRCE|nr:StAR-related lipid transfer protein 9 [Acropora cervicornis]
MLSILVLLYLLLMSVFLAIFTYVLFFRKKTVHDSSSAQDKITYVKKLLPLCGAKGWQLKMVDSGIRIWEKQINYNCPAWIPGIIYACCGIIPTSPQEVINVLKQPYLSMEWDPRIKACTKVTTATNHDAISLSFNCTGFIAQFLHQCRYWKTDGHPDAETWFISVFREQEIPLDTALWSCFLVSSAEDGDDDQSLVTLVVAPVSPMFAAVKQLTTSRIAGLQDFFAHYRANSPLATSASTIQSPEADLMTLSVRTGKDYNRVYLQFVRQRKGQMAGSVDIVKRPAQAGERPWDTFKGTTEVNAPALYTLAYICLFECRKDWDENFSLSQCGLQVVVTSVTFRLQMKFLKVSFSKHMKRGEIIIGGYLLEELSSKPPKCRVTHVTRVDLKGNLPARLVNRVTLSQPKSLAIAREKVEALYQAEAAGSSEDLSIVKKKSAELWSVMVKYKEAKSQHSEGAPEEEKEVMLGWSLVDGHDETESVLSSSESENHLRASNSSLKDILLIIKPSAIKQRRICLVSFHSVEKDVVILRKVSQGQKIYSFLGKGLIKVKPPAVWQAIRNPMTRHVYDKMLKKTKIVRQIDDQIRIAYLHHETTQCFFKQARDFVFLASERVEPERYVLSGVSVDVPELPPSKNIVRGKIYSSGWIIEPVLQNGQLYSMVSYLSQVDFGGAVPTGLLNHITRRQPLCIAYLRNYLQKFEYS